MTEFIIKWKEWPIRCLWKRKKGEGETIFKLLTAKLYYLLMEYLSDTKIPKDVGDFRNG